MTSPAALVLIATAADFDRAACSPTVITTLPDRNFATRTTNGIATAAAPLVVNSTAACNAACLMEPFCQAFATSGTSAQQLTCSLYSSVTNATTIQPTTSSGYLQRCSLLTSSACLAVAVIAQHWHRAAGSQGRVSAGRGAAQALPHYPHHHRHHLNLVHLPARSRTMRPVAALPATAAAPATVAAAAATQWALRWAWLWAALRWLLRWWRLSCGARGDTAPLPLVVAAALLPAGQGFRPARLTRGRPSCCPQSTAWAPLPLSRRLVAWARRS